MNLSGDSDDWNIPKRDESFIFIICGRNVPPSKFLRCWRSVLAQTRNDWGAVIVDDASDNSTPELIEFLIRGYKDKVTYIRNHERKGILANINRAIADFCINPYSVILILDADDMLLSEHILFNLHKYYLRGADMTVGSMFRLGKGIMPFVPDFKNPRNRRGGDVWMHLRTFRKYLFDNVRIEDMKIDSQWVDKFTELTYMVPIVEMAKNPIHIKWPLYLYEPTQIRDEEHYRKNKVTIEHVIRAGSYRKPIKMPMTPIKPPGEQLSDITNNCNVIFIRHGEKDCSESNDSISISESGIKDCQIWGSVLPIKLDLILTSPALIAKQTAENIRDGNGSECPIKELIGLRSVSNLNNNKWNELKTEYGWKGLIERCKHGKLPIGAIKPYKEIAKTGMLEIKKIIADHDARNIMIITHDHLISLFAYYFFDRLESKVRNLHGFVVDCEALEFGVD